MGVQLTTIRARLAGRGRQGRRALAGSLLLLVVGAVVAVVPAAQGSEGSSGLVEVGRVDFPADPNQFTTIRGSLVLDSQTRRGFRLYRDPDLGTLVIWAFDADTMANGARVDVPDFPASPTQKFGYFAAVGGGRLYAVDEVGWVHVFDQQTLERVGFWPSILPPPSGSSVTVANREQASLSARQSDAGTRTPVHPLVVGPGHRIIAFGYVDSYRPGGGPELLTLSHGYVNEADVPVAVVTLHRWDPVTGAEIATVRLSGCASGRGFGNDTRASTGVDVTVRPDGSHELLYGCIGRSIVGEVWTATIAADGSLADQVQVGAVSTASDFLLDPAGRRAHALTSSGVGQNLVAVDLERGGVVGAVGLSFDFDSQAAPGGVGATLDPTTGRLYALAPASRDPNTGKSSPGGLLVVDGRRAPLPQGFALTDLAAEAVEMVVVDPAVEGVRPARVYTRSRGEAFYRVYADRIALQADPTLADVDRFTIDHAEQDGVTRSAFGGGANGYGVRMLLVGGANALADPVSSVRGESLTKDMVTGFVANPGCGPTNRELILASIEPTTGLSDTAATAVAAAATADPRTIQDLGEPVASCFPAPLSRTELWGNRAHPDDFTLDTNAWRDTMVTDSDGDGTADQNLDRTLGPSWPFSEAVCLPPEKPADDAPHAGDGPYEGVSSPGGYTAHVECDLDGQKLVASARSAGADLAGLTIGRASSEAKIGRVTNDGVDVEVTSIVRDVEIGGVIQIGEVRATATSTAAGRPGTSGATFTSVLCGIRAPSFSESGCIDPRSDQSRSLIAALNSVLSQRQMQIRLPAPDAELAAGTPGGALAAVQKDRFAAQGEKLFNNDFLTALPAIEIVRVHDSTLGRGRQIYQLAGVQTSSSYNISLIPTGTGFGGAGSGGSAATGTGGGSPAVQSQTAGRTAAFDPAGAPLPAPLATLPPTPGQILSTLQHTITYVLTYAFRSPGDALAVVGLIFVAFALPLHLTERRRALAAALERSR